ncbi:hypothetical protein [Escherichia phage PJNS034]
MILSGTVNLQTVNTEKLVEIGEAVCIAMEQRKQLLRKKFRKHGKDALTDFELRLIDEAHDLGTDFNEALTLESKRHDEQLESDFAAMNAADNVGSETLKLLDIPAER